MIDKIKEVIEQGELPEGDYVSPGFYIVRPDHCFPNMIVGDTSVQPWPYLRREVPHNWYVDRRQPTVGFLSRDEAHILYNTALKFKGKKALEIGCWMGWSACHLALAGVKLDVIDPLLERPEFYESVSNSLKAAGVLDRVNLIAGYSPQKVKELAEQWQRKWSLIFIDGNHEAPGPLNDALACEQLAEEDALIIFHDLASPDVAQGLDYLKSKGWNTMVYQTMQIMGVAWRGNVEPVIHQPDPRVNWKLPIHLQHYYVSGLDTNSLQEFREIVAAIRPYSLLSEARLFSLYSLAKRVCIEDIPGNFVECGTYKGGAAALLAVVVKRYSLRPRRLYAFDTFEGMPEPSEVDRQDGIPANLTGFGAGTLKAPMSENIEKICEHLQVRDIVIPVKGLFAQTLPEYKSEIGDIAFLHADGDWYQSTMDIFNNLYDSIVVGGIIQVDDYGHWEGCRKALHDFEQVRGENFVLHRIDYTGVWFQKSEVSAEFLPINLRDINLIIFPDWTQPEESLGVELQRVIAALASHSDKNKISLLIDTSNISEEDANLVLSSVALNLLMEEDLDVADGPEISIIGQLSALQWQALLPRIHARIVLENENKQALAQVGAESLAFLPLENFINN